MLNRIVVIGRLTRDPELRSTSNGTPVATFTVAVDRNFSNNRGEKETDFIPVVVWRGLAETCGRYLSKGKLCAVDGRMQIRTYETSDGSKRTVAEVVADSVRFLSPKGETQGNNVSPSYEANPTATMDEFPEIDPFEDIPF
jgi:single-strand DNA-binding protein